MILETIIGSGCKWFISIIDSNAHFKSIYSGWGISNPGNKSLTIALKRGKSSFKNLGTLESIIAHIKTISSFSSGYSHLRAPAITNTDFTALIPKS